LLLVFAIDSALSAGSIRGCWQLATPSNNILGLPVSCLLVVERRRKKEHVENGIGDKVEVLEELTPAPSWEKRHGLLLLWFGRKKSVTSTSSMILVSFNCDFA
jgi:hypothetical protein